MGIDKSVSNISLTELQRQIEFQQSEYEFYQKQATLFFRISLATIGIIIAMSSIFGKSTLLQFSDLLLNFSLEQAAAQIDLSSIQTELLISILYLEFSAFLIISSIKLVGIPIYTFQVAYPNRLKSGLTTYQSRKLTLDCPANPEEYTIEKLRGTIVENEVVVNNTEENFKSALEGARDSVIYGFLAIMTLLTLIFGSTESNLVVMIVASVAAIEIASSEIPWGRYRGLRKFYWETWFPVVLVAGWAASNSIWNTSPKWLQALAALAFAIPIIAIWYSNTERLGYIIPQMFGILFFTFTALFLHTDIRPESYSSRYTYILSILLVSSVIFLAELFVSYQGLVIKQKVGESEAYRKFKGKVDKIINLADRRSAGP